MTTPPSELSESARGAKVPTVEAKDTASNRSVPGSSHRSAKSSHRSAPGTNNSTRSITSSVALAKLDQLEKMLLSERAARMEAENTMLALQQERLARDEALRKSEAAQKQLNDVLKAVRSVVDAPDNPGNIRRLQAVITGRPLTGGSVPSIEAEHPRCFLDGIGEYERQRNKALKEAKAHGGK